MVVAMDGKSSISVRRVAVLYGGDSAERDVSLTSGRQVADALQTAGYEPGLIDPAFTGLDEIDWRAFDVCFLALHGGAGENGWIQQALEERNIRYTGSGPQASQMAMSKSTAKKRFAECGVPSLPGVVVPANELSAVGADGPSGQWEKTQAELSALGFPLVIKPESQGSSLGISVANGPDDLAECLANAARYDRLVLAEPFVTGREFTISLLGRDPLPMIEIVAPQRLFTFDAKYSSPETQYEFESKLPAAVEAQLYRAAIGAAESLGTTGLVRVDLMLDRDDRAWVLEVNTIPGMTARSLAPRAARAAGMEMPALVDWIVRDAISRQSGTTTKAAVAKSGNLKVGAASAPR